MDVAEIYNQTLKHLPAAERLQLAALILSDIASRSLVDYSEEWTEEDLEDFTRATWNEDRPAPGTSRDAETG